MEFLYGAWLRMLGWIQGIAAGVSGSREFTLLSDAFYNETANFLSGTLDGLFTKIGIPGLWDWVNEHRTMIVFLRDFRGDASTPESELDSLVQYRNEAAHGDIQQIVALEEFIKVTNFVIALAESLAQMIMRHVIKRREANGLVEILGLVIRNFEGNVIGLECAGLKISVNDAVILMNDHACCYATVQTLQENHVTFDSIETKEAQKIALGVTVLAKIGSRVLRLRRPADYGHGEGI